MNIGDMVKIKECHAMPQLVGQAAKVVVIADPELTEYPIRVLLTDEAITVDLGLGKAQTKGPFPFREDELEPLPPDHGIPDVFKEA